MVFANQDKIPSFWDKIRSTVTELIPCQAVVVSPVGRLQRTARSSENIDTVEELVLIQEDAHAPESHRTLRHFEHKNDIIVILTFPIF